MGLGRADVWGNVRSRESFDQSDVSEVGDGEREGHGRAPIVEQRGRKESREEKIWQHEIGKLRKEEGSSKTSRRNSRRART